MTYQGSTNWETWNVELWVDNEQPLYLKKIRVFDRSTEPITAEQVKEFVDGYMAGCTPDVGKADMLKVDWDDIAESWETGRQEHWLYKFDAADRYDTFDEYLDSKTAEVQAELAPYDLGIEDEEIRELILEEEGDIESIIEGYLEDVKTDEAQAPIRVYSLYEIGELIPDEEGDIPPPQDDRPERLDGPFTELDEANEPVEEPKGKDE